MTYQQAYGALPPAYTARADGTRLHSWRVLVLPFLGQQQLYRQFDLAQPWDSPRNAALVAKMPGVFRCKNDVVGGRRYETSYVAIVGEGTAFPAESNCDLRRLHHKLGEIALVMETRRSGICWSEPRDFCINEVGHGTEGRRCSNDPQGPGLGFADGHCSRLTCEQAKEVISRTHVRSKDAPRAREVPDTQALHR